MHIKNINFYLKPIFQFYTQESAKQLGVQIKNTRFKSDNKAARGQGTHTNQSICLNIDTINHFSIKKRNIPCELFEESMIILILRWEFESIMRFFMLFCMLHKVTCDQKNSRMLKEQFFYTIDEEPFNNTIIANLIEDAGFSETLDIMTLKTLKFQQLNQPICNFMIEERTGIIVVIGRIDREELCSQQEEKFQNNYFIEKKLVSTCVCRLDIVVTPMNLFRSLQIYINILDVNDNTPSFPVNETTVYFLENSNINSSVTLPNPTDLDLKPNNIVNYKLKEYKDSLLTTESLRGAYFKVAFEHLTDHVDQLKLVLIRPIDREAQDSHFLVLTAEDGGQPSKSGLLNVVVQVKDVNDNNPTFDYNFQEVKVSENIAVGSLVSRVFATDADLGTNAFIVYSFDDVTVKKYNKFFEIGSKTGDIHVIGKLDYEENTVYKLMVRAQDKPILTEARSADAIVVVNVVDINDNPPVISLSAFAQTQSNIIGVEENLEEGSFVANLYVSDHDSGKNGEVYCYENSLFFKLKKVSLEGEFRLETELVFDRENASEYFISITCVDNGTPSLTTLKTLNVQIIDTNDHTPLWSHQNDIELRVQENDLNETVLFVFSATDEDQSGTLNSLIHYEFENSYTEQHLQLIQTYFALDKHNGQLKLKGNLIDREKNDFFEFSIKACDQGRPILCAIANVKIIVDDENDEKPQFPVKTFVFSLKENMPAGSELGVVTSKDNDLAPFNQHSFYIVNDSMLLNIHNTKMQKEEIVTKKIMKKTNKENETYDIKSNGNIHSYDSIEDTNLFSDYEFVEYKSLKTKKNKDSIILHKIEKIIDLKGGDTSKHRKHFLNPLINKTEKFEQDPTRTNSFSQPSTDEALEKTTQMFHLETKSGRLATRFKLDREMRNNYRFYIMVQDDNKQTLVSYAEVVVYVLDINDNPPVWLEPYLDASNEKTKLSKKISKSYDEEKINVSMKNGNYDKTPITGNEASEPLNKEKDKRKSNADRGNKSKSEF